ncbi:MAG: glutamine synthetase [Streptomyces sp.]|uniref:glutamine synthetase family protein n=1 Tax=Streptomyces sp. TaxID=1931 RepID=UPI0025DA1DC8|nr:glutamine synthetase family protein [Streptomyces sp.]MBW8800056.1 glutamine synthetase [Streptomyces sp.]
MTGRIDLEALKEPMRRGGIRTVMAAIPDMRGHLKGKRLNSLALLERLGDFGGNRVAEACAYILATNADMDPLSGFDLTSWSDGFQDMGVDADWRSLRMLPYMSSLALVHCDAVDLDGTPIEVAPRQILRRQLERLAGLGYQVKIGLESEFVLYNGPEPAVGRNIDYDFDLPPQTATFLGHLETVLPDAGVPIEAVKPEGAPGQFEVTFPYTSASPLEACDNYTVYRHALRHTAQQHGMTASFMAAPETGVGSGLHLHLSLWRDDRAAFATASHRDMPTEAMGHSIAGLMGAMPHLAPFFAPTTNAYKRYASRHSFAPYFMSWGPDNRGCAIRVTGHGQGTHLEVRLGGADANPYLLTAAALASIAHGLSKKLTLPPPCLGDAYADRSSLPLPRDLTEALRDFQTSALAHDLFGTPLVVHYSRAAQAEVDEQQRTVTDVERRHLATA